MRPAYVSRVCTMSSGPGIRSKPNDNEPIADSLAFLLRCQGRHAAVSCDGATALRLLRTEAVLPGQVIGLLSGLSAVPLIRAGRLVPLLTARATDPMSVYLYYGGRPAQPSRARAFIDLSVERLAESCGHVLDARELVPASMT